MPNKIEHNNSLLGFENLTDFATTLVGWKTKYFVGTASILGGFITSYIYHSEIAIYFLLFLLAMDTVTAVLRAIKQNKFTSKRLPRILAIMLSYMLLLACSTWMSHFSILYAWLPGALYTGFISVLFVSIGENLMLSGWIPADLYFQIKEKINLKKLFSKKVNEEETTTTPTNKENGPEGNN